MKKFRILSVSFILCVSILLSSQQPTIISAKTQTVYITSTGTKYHVRKCGRGKYTNVTLSKAKKLGLKPCKKCYGR